MGHLLIISQYYSSYQFIVVEDTHTERHTKLKSMVEDLVRHKASDYQLDQLKEFGGSYLGDLDDQYYRADSHRYNVNFAGDIYILAVPMGEMMYHIQEYQDRGNEAKRWYDKRTKEYMRVMDDMGTKHKRSDLVKIIQKHFKVVA